MMKEDVTGYESDSIHFCHSFCCRRLFDIRHLGGFLIAALLCSPSTQGFAQTKWPDEKLAGRFVCHADFSLDPISRLLDDLEALQKDLSAQLGVVDSDESVHLFLFHDRAAYQHYMKRHFPGVPARKALFVKGRGPGMIFAAHSQQLAVDLRHESTHALLHSVLPRVPLWLDEGLAEYFEAAPPERSSGSVHLRSIRWSSRLGRVPRMTDLESLQELEEMKESDYRDAWAWVHFMLHGPAAGGAELKQYLADLASDTPTGQLGDRLRRRVPNLERAFLSHFRKWR